MIHRQQLYIQWTYTVIDRRLRGVIIPRRRKKRRQSICDNDYCLKFMYLIFMLIWRQTIDFCSLHCVNATISRHLRVDLLYLLYFHLLSNSHWFKRTRWSSRSFTCQRLWRRCFTSDRNIKLFAMGKMFSVNNYCSSWRGFISVVITSDVENRWHELSAVVLTMNRCVSGDTWRSLQHPEEDGLHESVAASIWNDIRKVFFISNTRSRAEDIQ